MEAAAAGTDEEGGTTSRRNKARPTSLPPFLNCANGRLADRHSALLAALAQHPDRPTTKIEIIHVQPAELAHTHPGGVEELEKGPIPEGQCRGILLRSRLWHRKIVEQSRRLVLPEDGRQLTVLLRCAEQWTRVTRD